MKKLLLVLAVAGFVACNNSGESTPADSTPAVDTSVVTVDTTVVTTDSTAIPDSTKK